MTMYWISLRNGTGDAFGTGTRNSPLYLAWEGNAPPTPKSRSLPGTLWAKEVLRAAETSRNIVFFVHGYANQPANVFERHTLLQTGLAEHGFDCTVVSFDWASGDATLAYGKDRHTAKETAFALVDSGISLLAKFMRPDCDVNIHVVAHSMGALVIREAFDDADDTAATAGGWTISQLVVLAGDVSSDSMAEGNSSSESIYRHVYRLSNYFSNRDEALQISNAKHFGVAPRVGRVGLPDDSPDKAIDIDCTKHYGGNVETLKDVIAADVTLSHSWYFYDQTVMKDIAETLRGKLDRNAFPTREAATKNSFILK